jgi:hypothetical protein
VTKTDSRVVELKKILAGKVKDLQDFRDNGIKVDGQNVTVSGEDATKAATLWAECQQLESLIKMGDGGEKMAAWLNETEGSKSTALYAMNEALKDSMEGKSLGEAFIGSDEFKHFQKTGRSTMDEPFAVESYDIVRRSERKDVYSNLNPHNISLGIGTRPQFDALVPRGQRTARVRDLFPVATTNNNLIDFFRVLGFNEGGGAGQAAPVADYSGGAFGLKPKSTLNFQPAQAPVRTIAHWEAAHRNVIQDVPQLQATINNELLYGLALVEDEQILRGDGTGENLLGILNTPGIQTYTPSGAEPKADSLRKAQTFAIIANYPPSGYVVHPNDWEDIELDKGTTNDHYRLVTNIAVGAEARVWRLPIVETPAMNEGTFLTGAFGTGAQLYDRQAANVRIAEQHADFFVRNAIVILVEERLALATKRPESFVKGSYLTS